MSLSRLCSRQGCSQGAVATLTFVYADSMVVIGPLAMYSEPHGYDLCEMHAYSLTVPRGWEVTRLEYAAATPDDDGLFALHKALTRREVEKGEFSSEREQKPILDPHRIFSPRDGGQHKSLRALGDKEAFEVAKPKIERTEKK